MHSSGLGGHVGKRKLLKLASDRFFWKQMSQSVDKFCKTCSICQKSKVSTQKKQGLLQPLQNPSSTFEHISMDFIGPLPVTKRGFDAIYTVVDRFSRYSVFIPAKTTWSAADVAQSLFDNWITKFGVPSKIISDRDTRFTSNFWQSLFKLMDTKLAMSTAYHP